MTFEEYREFYLSDINNTALSESLHPIDAFINDVTDMMINDMNLLNDYHICAYEWKNGNRAFKNMKIDAYSVDVVTNTINLIIADYNDEEIKTLNQESINNLSQYMINFFENVLKGFFQNTEQSANYTQASQNIRKNIDLIDKLHLYIISTNKISERVKDLLLSSFIYQGRAFKIKLDVIDFNRIYQVRAESFDKEDVIIETKTYGVGGIPCIKADIGTKTYDSYLAVIPGEFLADIYDEYSSRLLESNVRSFLSFRGGINKGIRGTILNCQDKFFTYNNGISALAKEIESTYIERKGLFITKFIGLQIINGGQTTASLASTRIKDKASLKNIFVQMKLTIIKEEDAEFVRNIAKFANSQNKVTSADLNSNHPFYIRVEEFSRKIFSPASDGKPYQELWFFERARGQYEQPLIKMTTKKQRDDYQKIRPKNKKFTKMDLAKYENSADMKPFYVSWGSDVNATKFQEQLDRKWDEDNSVFNEFYYKELIGKAILFKSLEKIISNQQWYLEKKDFRPQLVTYTFAKFVYEAKKIGMEVNYKDIWDKQKLPSQLENQLAKIAKMAFNNIYNEKREIANISTYCKNKICWERLQDMSFQFDEESIKYLISKEDRQINMISAKKEQRNESNLNYAVDIFKRGQNYWSNLLTKGVEQKELNQTEIEFLNLAINSIKNGKLVTNKQAVFIMNIVKKLNKVGIV